MLELLLKRFCSGLCLHFGKRIHEMNKLAKIVCDLMFTTFFPERADRDILQDFSPSSS